MKESRMKTPLNLTYAQLIVDELIRQGVTRFVCSPGSRSTPLVFAISLRKEHIKYHIIIDERSAGFFALGQAKETAQPVALICTSGTAVANYFPAIVEAHYTNIPMIVLSADRPHSLRDAGANQTIDQIKIFGGYVNHFVDLPTPQPSITDHERKVLTGIAAKAYHASLFPTKGVVHLNLPFVKPLEPTEEETLENLKFVKGSKIKFFHPRKLNGFENGDDSFQGKVLIIMGAIIPDDLDLFDLKALLEQKGVPVVADVLTNFRSLGCSTLIQSFEGILSSSNFVKRFDPDTIILIGKNPSSISVNKFLYKTKAQKIQLSTNSDWNDETYQTTLKVELPGEQIPEFLNNSITQIDTGYLSLLSSLDKSLDDSLPQSFSEIGVANKLLQMLEDSTIFLANSSVIRNFDIVYRFSPHKSLRFLGNRGVSGIDGNISTAVGVALSSENRVYAIMGDLAFLHDLNSMSIVQKYKPKVGIIVFNNSGGGLFKRLPIFQHKTVFSEFYSTPQNFNIKDICAAFSLDYYEVTAMESLNRFNFAEMETPFCLEIKLISDAEPEAYLEYLKTCQNKMA